MPGFSSGAVRSCPSTGAPIAVPVAVLSVPAPEPTEALLDTAGQLDDALLDRPVRPGRAPLDALFDLVWPQPLRMRELQRGDENDPQQGDLPQRMQNGKADQFG
jgi:hypothetical protein